LQNKAEFISGKFLLEQDRCKLYNYFDSIASSSNNSKDIKSAKGNMQLLKDGKKCDNVLLQPDNNSFFIMSKSSNNPDAFVKISRIAQTDDKTLKILWETEMAGMFFNIATAQKTEKFKRYFGDMVPDFEYELFAITGNKLVVIFHQYMECVDIFSGKILWKVSIKV
jgi:hypothetical protein